MTVEKDQKFIDLKDSLAEAYAYSDFLVVRIQGKDGGTEGSETKHEATVKKDLKSTDFKDLLVKVHTHSGCQAVRRRNEESGAREPLTRCSDMSTT